jgi:hypothetical protein
MLDTLFTGGISETLTLSGTILTLLGAVILGLFVSAAYRWMHRNESCSPSFTVSLVMLPAIIAMIILLIGNNVARAFSLAGAFSLIRFRSAPGDSRDIAYVFFSLGVGLACGMGYIGYAALFAVLLCGVMMALKALKYGESKSLPMHLKIVIPEDLDYQGVFDEILRDYTGSFKLIKVKTAEFGSLFELHYEIKTNGDKSAKEMIDRLRCKNGNLSIVLSGAEAREAAVF